MELCWSLVRYGDLEDKIKERILVCGSSANTRNRDMAIWRYK